MTKNIEINKFTDGEWAKWAGEAIIAGITIIAGVVIYVFKGMSNNLKKNSNKIAEIEREVKDIQGAVKILDLYIHDNIHDFRRIINGMPPKNKDHFLAYIAKEKLKKERHKKEEEQNQELIKQNREIIQLLKIQNENNISS